LAEVEVALRAFVARVMVELYGFDWWNNYAPKKAKDGIKRARTDGITHPLEQILFEQLIHFLEAEITLPIEEIEISTKDLAALLFLQPDLETIRKSIADRLPSRSLWDIAFKNYFESDEQKNEVLNELKQMGFFRNDVMHHRPFSASQVTKLRRGATKVIEALSHSKKALQEDTRSEVIKEMPTVDSISDAFSAATEEMKRVTQFATIAASMLPTYNIPQETFASIARIGSLGSLFAPQQAIAAANSAKIAAALSTLNASTSSIQSSMKSSLFDIGKNSTNIFGTLTKPSNYFEKLPKSQNILGQFGKSGADLFNPPKGPKSLHDKLTGFVNPEDNNSPKKNTIADALNRMATPPKPKPKRKKK
jgi:hypothetical protein